MAATLLYRLQRIASPTSRIQSPIAFQQSLHIRLLSSGLENRGFLDVLRFKTIQPLNGQLKPQDFRCKAALVVNTASKCSHASQLKQLQTLHEKYSEQGLIVVAVPSNDFAGQEPGSIDDILKRYMEFGVTFAIAEKTSVKGDNAHPFFRKIADKYGASVAPTWNFDKFLVDHRGEMIAVFPNDTEPLIDEVVAEIEEVLADLPRDLTFGEKIIDGNESSRHEMNEEDAEDKDK